MKTIYEAILNRKNSVADSAEHHYIKQILLPDEHDSSEWPDGSVYMVKQTLVFDFDKTSGRYEGLVNYGVNFQEAIKEFGIQEILFKGSKLKSMEFEGLGCSFYKVKITNKSTIPIMFRAVYDASEVEGDIIFRQKQDYYFTDNDFRNTGVFQARTKGYLRTVNGNMEYADWRKVKGMVPKEVLSYIYKKFDIPENIHFSLGGNIQFIKGIKDRKEIDKFIFYSLKPKDFIQHPEIPDLYYCVK